MENSSFFNAIIQNGVPDRVYKADIFASYFSSFIGNGVFPNPSTNLQVLATDSNMTVRIKSGKAFINGYYYNNDDDLILSIDNADGVLHRIDSIVVRLDFINREIRTYVKKGAFSSSPTPPELQRDDARYELCIADIRINAGDIKITQSKITDTRLDTEVCGIVTQTINEIDTTALYNQLQAHIQEKSLDMDTWLDETKVYFENDFNTWFEGIKDILDENTAGNLLNEINKLKEAMENVSTDAVGTSYDNSKSKLKATNAQDAIDEVNAKSSANEKSILDLQKQLDGQISKAKTILTNLSSKVE